MTRIRIAVLAGLAVGLTGWLVTRTDKAAHAADDAPAVVASYGDNTEECAQRRYVGSGAHHWRYVMLKR